ncbi:OLC1v1039107C1 [Oldenlandia corymbosa var. corymbosa]|uniref:OLC1v1039107C1 n=1 Tax=Oldenlandia corymbosa var. corymbosa TaxID=529605 RepID=A0AAV1D3J5_OLDCO|nr:OLC1v1039107C1 [Oldenlandia corymbosa var. corymbosa]
MGTAPEKSEQELLKELTEFDETKVGVKGLVDSGIAKIPNIFVFPKRNQESRNNNKSSNVNDPCQLPIIDFDGIEKNRQSRRETVEQIRQAMEKWGFFQMVNHGVPVNSLNGLLRSIKEFHEQPEEVRKGYYSRDHTKKIKYYTTGDMYQTKAAQWRDTLSLDFDDSDNLDLHSLPELCRDGIEEYIYCLTGVRNQLSELLSEALGLEKDHLGNMECFEIRRLLCHYYPPCPEPDLTLGIMKHSDPYYLTILLQDSIGGFQVFHKNQWLDVPPIEGSLLVNAGDLLQLVTNDKFKSVEHRVIAGRTGPRISAACFMYPDVDNQFKPFGPIKELLSETNPAKYRETSIIDYLRYYAGKGLDGVKSLPHFQLIPAEK